MARLRVVLTPWRRWVLKQLPAPLLREPFALWIALACLLSATAQLLGIDEPTSIARLLPRLLVATWNVELFVGGVLTLAGILSSRPRWLILGLAPLGFGCFAYASAVAFIAGLRGLFPGLLIGALGVACLIKSFAYSTGRVRLVIDREED